MRGGLSFGTEYERFFCNTEKLIMSRPVDIQYDSRYRWIGFEAVRSYTASPTALNRCDAFSEFEHVLPRLGANLKWATPLLTPFGIIRRV